MDIQQAANQKLQPACSNLQFTSTIKYVVILICQRNNMGFVLDLVLFLIREKQVKDVGYCDLQTGTIHYKHWVKTQRFSKELKEVHSSLTPE